MAFLSIPSDNSLQLGGLDGVAVPTVAMVAISKQGTIETRVKNADRMVFPRQGDALVDEKTSLFQPVCPGVAIMRRFLPKRSPISIIHGAPRR
jgi:hypothetical protein